MQLRSTPTSQRPYSQVKMGSFDSSLYVLCSFGNPGEVGDPDSAAVRPAIIAQQWLDLLEDVLSKGDVSRLDTVFHRDCWWRDALTFTWDLRTLHGVDKLTQYIASNLQVQLSNLRLRESGKFVPSLKTPAEGLSWIESMFDFDTKIGRGSGMLRVARGRDGSWKGYMMYTVLKELKGFEEINGHNRPHGGNSSLLGGFIEGNWQERRHRQIEFLIEEPCVLIIGAGQSGLNLAARLQALSISCLIVDKNARIGDNWRDRYRVSLGGNQPILIYRMLMSKDTGHT